MTRIKFTDARGNTYWLRRGKLVHRRDNATLYAHPSAAKEALTRFIRCFLVVGWSIEIMQVKQRFRNQPTGGVK